MTPAEFADLAAELIGHPVDWKSAIARTLKVRRQTIHCWLAGAYPVNPASAELIRKLVAEKRAALEELFT